jgi:putative membrane protein
MAGNDNTGFSKRWIFTWVAVLAATQIVPGIRSEGWPAILITALLLGIFNAFLRPALIILTLPIQIVTLGLFTLVINAILLLLAGTLVGPFHVDGFWDAFFGALIISVFGGFLNLFFGGGSRTARAHVNTGQTRPAPSSPPPPQKENPPPGKGPIIDV